MNISPDFFDEEKISEIQNIFLDRYKTYIKEKSIK
jgi:hypothetical protein